MSGLSAYLGLARSLLIYNGRPFRIRRLADFYRHFIRHGELCLDIGAHVGTHIKALRRIGARVVALEPQPLFFRYLERKFARDGGVELLPLAAGSREGAATMQISRRTPTVSSLSPDWSRRVAGYRSFRNVEWEQTLQVELTTIDILIRRFGPPAFCKIDVEGFEEQVLQGLHHPIKTISFEFIPGSADLLAGCLDQIGRLGEYEFNWTLAETMRLAGSNWIDSKELYSALQTLGSDAPSMDIIARSKSAVEAGAA